MNNEWRKFILSAQRIVTNRCSLRHIICHCASRPVICASYDRM